jgi:hypothetical protein
VCGHGVLVRGEGGSGILLAKLSALEPGGTEGEATVGSSTYSSRAARAGVGKARRTRVSGRGAQQRGLLRRFSVRARLGRPTA